MTVIGALSSFASDARSLPLLTTPPDRILDRILAATKAELKRPLWTAFWHLDLELPQQHQADVHTEGFAKGSQAIRIGCP